MQDKPNRYRQDKIRLKDIPEELFDVITSKGEKALYLGGKRVENMFLFRNSQIRINTEHGQYRRSMTDNETYLDIY